MMARMDPQVSFTDAGDLLSGAKVRLPSLSTRSFAFRVSFRAFFRLNRWATGHFTIWVVLSPIFN